MTCLIFNTSGMRMLPRQNTFGRYLENVVAGVKAFLAALPNTALFNGIDANARSAKAGFCLADCLTSSSRKSKRLHSCSTVMNNAIRGKLSDTFEVSDSDATTRHFALRAFISYSARLVDTF